MRHHSYNYNNSRHEGGVIIHRDGTIERDPYSSDTSLLNKIEHINSLENVGLISRADAEQKVSEITKGE